MLSGSEGNVKLWDAATGKLLRMFQQHSDEVTSIAFSGDGRHIVSGSKDGTFKLWDTDRGGLLASLIATPDGEPLSITPAGFFVASPKGGELIEHRSRPDGLRCQPDVSGSVRPDLMREKLAGDPDGEVKKAAGVLDLDKVIDSGNHHRWRSRRLSVAAPRVKK